MSRIITTELAKIEIEKLGAKLPENWQYVNAWEKFLLTCARSHVRTVCWHDLQQGHRCLQCSFEDQRISEDKLKQIVKDKNGKLDNDFKYKGSKTKFFVTCENGHRWKTCWSVLKNHWCATCFNNKHSMQRLIKRKSRIQSYVESKNCKLDIDNWDNKKRNSRFWVICNNGHRWESDETYLKITNCLCPACQKFSREYKFRQVLHRFFGVNFPKRRPRWLKKKSSDRMGLELDGYNETLKIAFEYQGQQHYQISYYNKRSLEILQRIQGNDKFKKEQCRNNGINLIVIPYWIPEENWKKLIKETVL